MFKIGVLNLILLAPLPAGAASNYKLSMSFNNSQSAQMKAALKTKVNLEMTHVDATEPTTEFEKYFGKEMHLIIVKDDLSEFARLFPHQVDGPGQFQIHFNAAPKDPDNGMAKGIVRTPGRYFAFALAKPKSEVSIALAVAEFESLNHEKAPQAPRCHPPFDPIPFVYLDDSGQKTNSSERAKYRVDLEMTTVESCDSPQLQIQASLRRKGEEGDFDQSPKIENYLEAKAHLFMISYKGLSTDERFFSHLVAEETRETDSLVFFHKDEFNPLFNGAYRIWIQAKVDSKLVAIPFDFEHQNTLQNMRCTCDTADERE